MSKNNTHIHLLKSSNNELQLSNSSTPAEFRKNMRHFHHSSPVIKHTPNIVASSPHCSQYCGLHSQVPSTLSAIIMFHGRLVTSISGYIWRPLYGLSQLNELLPVLPGTPESHSISPVHSLIRLIGDYDPTTTVHTLRLKAINIHFPDNNYMSPGFCWCFITYFHINSVCSAQRSIASC